MTIALEFIDFVVPIELIRQRYPGGWEQCLIDHRSLIGGRVWFDEYLFRDGSMSPAGVEALVDEWIGLGFQPWDERDGERFWRDCCVVESIFGGPTLHCDWLVMGEDGRSAFLKGHPDTEVVGRKDVRQPSP
jgi:hypothetical protein